MTSFSYLRFSSHIISKCRDKNILLQYDIYNYIHDIFYNVKITLMCQNPYNGFLKPCDHLYIYIHYL